MNTNAQATSDVFAALGDPVRLRLACCLAEEPTGLCVCELVDALTVSQPNVSRHLRILQQAGLLDVRRDGRWAYYRLRQVNHPLLNGIRTCVASACGCMDIQDDLVRLRTRLSLRRGGKCVIGTRSRPLSRVNDRKGGEPDVRLPVVH
ncbi:MAG: ArsR/SmtB family transcription factor [Gemmatimonadales bacterium]